MDGSLGASGRGFENLICCWSQLVPQNCRPSIVFTCRLGTEYHSCSEGPWGQVEQDVCYCVPSPSLSFLCAKVASLPLSFPECLVLADLPGLFSPCPPAIPLQLGLNTPPTLCEPQRVGWETGWQQRVEASPCPAWPVAAAEGRSAWAWCAPGVSSPFPAMPVRGLLHRAQKQVKPGPGLQGAVMPTDNFSTRKRSAALRGPAYCHGSSAGPPVGWPSPSHWGWMGPFICNSSSGLELAPGPRGRGEGRGRRCVFSQAPAPGPHGHLHINGLRRGVCRGSGP